MIYDHTFYFCQQSYNGTQISNCPECLNGSLQLKNAFLPRNSVFTEIWGHSRKSGQASPDSEVWTTQVFIPESDQHLDQKARKAGSAHIATATRASAELSAEHPDPSVAETKKGRGAPAGRPGIWLILINVLMTY